MALKSAIESHFVENCAYPSILFILFLEHGLALPPNERVHVLHVMGEYLFALGKFIYLVLPDSLLCLGGTSECGED